MTEIIKTIHQTDSKSVIKRFR